jgi:hypothetical protein
MCVTLDVAYPAVAHEAREAIAAVFPESRVTQRSYPERGRTNVQISNAALPLAFSQCGQGRKHERSIVLAGWQRELTRRHPRALLRGLIHSDGCRTVNRFKTRGIDGNLTQRAYPRYFFSNLSADIRAIFSEHCELLGIRWTQSNPRSVSVARRDSVALLDEFVGPKR